MRAALLAMECPTFDTQRQDRRCLQCRRSINRAWSLACRWWRPAFLFPEHAAPSHRLPEPRELEVAQPARKSNLSMRSRTPWCRRRGAWWPWWSQRGAIPSGTAIHRGISPAAFRGSHHARWQYTDIL